MLWLFQRIAKLSFYTNCLHRDCFQVLSNDVAFNSISGNLGPKMFCLRSNARCWALPKIELLDDCLIWAAPKKNDSITNFPAAACSIFGNFNFRNDFVHCFPCTAGMRMFDSCAFFPTFLGGSQSQQYPVETLSAVGEVCKPTLNDNKTKKEGPNDFSRH